MFARRENDAPPHKRRCVATMRDILDGRRNLKIIEVGAHEDIAGIFRCGPQRNIYLDARMQSNAASADRFL